MMKHIFITLLLTLVSFPGLAMKKAKASAFDESFVTHEQFVLMNDQEQKLIVIKIMEYMSSAEASSKIQEIVNNGTPAEKEKWKRVVQFFSQIIMNEAHAQDPYSKYNNAAKNARSKITGGHQCIYAGWVSQTSYDVSNKKTYCNHPDKVKGKNSSSLTGYSATSSCPTGPKGKEKIVCNPSLYGFKTGSTPFCARAAPDMHNSSMECMELALSGDPAEVEARLKSIAKNMEKNKELFKDLMSFVFFNCACESSMGEERANTDYRNYMRPHRTCYGLLNQLKNVLSKNECVVIDEDPNFKIMVGFLNKLQDQVISSPKLTDPVDVCQKKFDTGKSSCDEKKEEKEKNACLSTIEAEKNNCLIVAKAKSLSTTGAQRNIDFDKDYGAIVDSIYDSDKDVENFCKSYASGKPLTPPTTTTSGSQGGGDQTPTSSCKITCVIKPKVEAEDQGSQENTVSNPDGAADPTKGANQTPKVEEEKVEETLYECTKTIETTGKDPEVIKPAFMVKNKEELDKNLKHGELTCTAESLPEPSKEGGSDTDEDPKGGLTSTLTTTPGTDKVTLTVTVKDGDKDPEGKITYLWYKEGDSAKSSLGSSSSLEQPMSTEKQKFCVDISADAERKVDGKDVSTQCGEVAAKEVAPNNQGGGQQPAPPRPQQRQQNIHINWGVR